MDLRQLEYIVQIAEENNITRAAEKLYITQSALNQQLLKLEKELGVPLFHRSRTDWHPTEAGEIYLSAARKMLQNEKDTYYRIHDLAEIQKGQLSVGFTPGRGIIMFSHYFIPDSTGCIRISQLYQGSSVYRNSSRFFCPAAWIWALSP